MPTPEKHIDETLDALTHSLDNNQIVCFGKKKGKDAVLVELALTLRKASDLLRLMKETFPDGDARSVASEIVQEMQQGYDQSVHESGLLCGTVLHRESLKLCGPGPTVNWLAERAEREVVLRGSRLTKMDVKMTDDDVMNQKQITFAASSVHDWRFIRQDGIRGLTEFMPTMMARTVVQDSNTVLLRKRLLITPLTFRDNAIRLEASRNLSFRLTNFLRAAFFRQLLSVVTILEEKERPSQ